jgi:hypothetical protein
MAYRSQFSGATLLAGMLQAAMSWVFIGFVWSIYWGYLIYQKSHQEELPMFED